MREDSKMRAVTVDPAMFDGITFLMATAKNEFNADRDAPRKQKTRDGMPVWTVKCAVMMSHNGRMDGDTITVSVPHRSDPSEEFQGGDLVRFDRLQFGVTETRSGYTTWFSADGLRPAAVAPVKAA